MSDEIPEEWKKLFEHSMEGDLEAIKQWVEQPDNKPFVNWKDDSVEHGRTMFRCVIDAGKLDVAKLLLEHEVVLVVLPAQDCSLLGRCCEASTMVLYYTASSSVLKNLAGMLYNCILVVS